MEPTNANPSSLPHGADSAPRTTSAPAPHVPPAPAWRQVPAVCWGALVIGALAFVVRVSSQQISVGGPEGYSCSYTDFAGFLAAGLIVVLTVVGWSRRAGVHAALRLPLPLMSALTVLLLALAFVHVLRGSGTIMSPCDARPLP